MEPQPTFTHLKVKNRTLASLKYSSGSLLLCYLCKWPRINRILQLSCISNPSSLNGQLEPSSFSFSLHLSWLWSDAYDQSGLQEVQLEDGSTAYIQHTVHMPQSNTILAIQADGTIADLQTEATAIDPETISVLEQYTTKVNIQSLHLSHL